MTEIWILCVWQTHVKSHSTCINHQFSSYVCFSIITLLFKQVAVDALSEPTPHNEMVADEDRIGDDSEYAGSHLTDVVNHVESSESAQIGGLPDQANVSKNL